MEVRIACLAEKRLVGQHLRMSLADNRTVELWQAFMPRRKEIQNVASSDLFSMQVYSKRFDLKDFSLDTPFEKWAAVEVSGFDDIPDGMASFVLSGGLYAVFLYKGDSRAFHDAFQFIFSDWIPNSPYEVDDRPHFEWLGLKYKNNDPDSEEEIWIPIRFKC